MPNACCSHYSPGINLITFYLPAFLSFSCSASVRILTAPMAPRASPKQSNAAAVLFTSTLIFLPSSSGIAALRSTPSGLRQQNPTMHARILAKCPRHKKNHIKGACVRVCVCVQNQKHEPHTKLWGTIPTLVFRVPLLHPYQTKPLEWLDICTGIWSVRKMPRL